MEDDVIGPLLVGTAIVVPMVIFHVAGLLFLSQLLKRLAKRSPEQDPLALWWFLTVAVLAILGLHSVCQKTPTPTRVLRRSAILSARFQPRSRRHRHH